MSARISMAREGWVQVSFDEAVAVVSDRGRRIKQKEYLQAGAVAIVDQGDGLIGGYTDNVAATVDHKGAIIVFGDHTRRFKYVDFPFAVGADGVKLFAATDLFDSRFLFCQLESVELEDRGYGRHYQHLRKAILCVPPKAEQFRIVEKLEELLSDLDAGVAELKAAQRKLAQYRQSLLKAAVEGALTADWRARRHSPSPQPLPHQGGGAETAEAADAGETDHADRDAAMTQKAARPSASAPARERSPRPPTASGTSAPLSPRGRGAGGEGANHISPPPPALLRQRARDMRHEPTPQEHQLWQQLRAKRFAGYKFRRQQPIGRYIVDFVCLAERLIVELDGGQHGDAAAYDAERDRWLQSQGFRVLRFWNNEWAQHTAAVLDAIWAALQASPAVSDADAAAPPPLPNPHPGPGAARLGVHGHADLRSANVSAHPTRGDGLESETGAELLQRILRERRARWEQKQLAKFAEQGKTPPKGWQDKYPEPVAPDLTDLPPLPEGWVWATIDQLSSVVRNGLSQKPEVDPVGYPILRINAVRSMLVNLDEVRYLSISSDEAEPYLLKNGDLLATRYNGSVDLLGVIGVVRGLSRDTLHPDKLIRIEPVLNELIADWIEVAATSGASRAHVVSRVKTTAGQTGISGDDLKRMPVPLPSLSEQAEVIETASRILDGIHLKRQAADHLLHMIAAQRKNILKAAFSGQLVPQDPNDEPASELLARIRAQREADAGAPARKRGRKAKGAA